MPDTASSCPFTTTPPLTGSISKPLLTDASKHQIQSTRRSFVSTLEKDANVLDRQKDRLSLTDSLTDLMTDSLKHTCRKSRRVFRDDPSMIHESTTNIRRALFRVYLWCVWCIYYARVLDVVNLQPHHEPGHSFLHQHHQVPNNTESLIIHLRYF